MTAVGTTPDSFDLVIADPLSLLNEIAKRYDSPARILMEYVDNALDDAEQLYRNNRGRYPYEIAVSVQIDTARAEVTVTDNCRGMTRQTLRRIVEKIGESPKRGLTWVNGRFGFGVHAFRAAASRIRFRSKHDADSCVELAFTRTQRTGIRPPAECGEPLGTASGTVVTIGGFERSWLQDLTAGPTGGDPVTFTDREPPKPGEGKDQGTRGTGTGKLPGEGADGVSREPDPAPNPPSAAARRKSGFDIKFQNLPPDINGAVRRSRFLDGTIYINVGHEDFDGRVGYSRQGELRLTERLVNYLAGVISIHYKDVYYDKYKNQPDRLDRLFDEQIEFIYRLESALNGQMAALQSRLSHDLVGEGHHGE
jgi:hypothetical protein